MSANSIPIKALKDEAGNIFVPLVSTEGIQDPQGETLEQKLQNKLEKTNIIAGDNITLTKSGNNITINSSAVGVLIDNLNTSTANQGALDAHQGKVLKEMVEDSVVNVIDDLTSTSSTSALSANQGYLLNNNKQATLVSGSNIKTINNQSILGSGNIEIQTGGDATNGAAIQTTEPDTDEYALWIDPTEDIIPNTEITNSYSTSDTLAYSCDYINSFLLDYCHPVGEVFTTVDSDFDPNTAWGGTWVQLVSDAYFKIVTSDAGSLGGTSATHQIPLTSIPSHSHNVGWDKDGAYNATGYVYSVHSAGVSGSYSTAPTSNSGGGQAYYPYYYGVIAWKRTA